MRVVVLDALGAKRLNACGGRAEVSEGLPVMFVASLLDEFSGQFGSVHVGVEAAFHLLNCML